MPKVSVITINRNNAAGLEVTLQSLAGQTSRDWESLVIDGASTDGSVEVISRFGDIVSRWKSEPDKGIYDAQNKGIVLAAGDYLLFLNSGDKLASPEVLSMAIPALSGDVCYGDLILLKNGREEKMRAADPVDLEFMMTSTLWHPCTFIKRQLFDQLGAYNDTLRIAGDYEFFVRCFLKPGITFHHLPMYIAAFDGSGVSSQAANASALKGEREIAWLLNVSPAVYKVFKAYTWFRRSRYYQLVRRLESWRGRKDILQ